MIIDGRKTAQEIVEKLKTLPTPPKILAAVLVGSNPASISFLNQKEKLAKELGVDFRIYQFKDELKNDDLRQEVGRLAKQNPIGGIIVQLPLPEHINRHYVLNAIPREKDIDVLGERALGAFYVGRNPVLPPAVGVVEEILKYLYENTKKYESAKNLKSAVIGYGFLIGKPVVFWLADKVSELAIFNENTEKLRNKLKNTDLIISGVGKADLFSAEDLSEDTAVIDFGYDMFGDKISGDFNCVDNAQFKIHYTPTPGGTGPILVARLLENFYKLNDTNY